MGSFGLGVDPDRRDLERSTRPFEPAGTDLEVERIQHDLVDRLLDIEHDGLAPGEGRSLQVGLQDEVVPARYDRARETVAGFVVHEGRAYRPQA